MTALDQRRVSYVKIETVFQTVMFNNGKSVQSAENVCCYFEMFLFQHEEKSLCVENSFLT